MLKGKMDAASSSTQAPDSSSSSFPSSGWDYEVFLSFRGPDTRKTFTDHLYNALVSRGISTFRDDEELRIGEEIDPALRSAIHESKIAIPIFSKGYAGSKWCLRELAEIVGCMKQKGQRQITVMPVFYHVDPTHVRYQTGCYEEAFRNHEKRYGQETEGWKKALKEVADLKGWDVEKIADGHEGKLIQLIVEEILSKLMKNPLIVSDNLIGIHSHVDKMKKFLNVGADDRRIVGIHGLGGIGKTTIARCVYNTIHHHFEGCSFIADARETFPKSRRVHLQRQLLIDILKMENPNITSVDQGINMIRQRFSNKKVLIVVDDVDEDTDLNVIIGKRDWFGIGSRIIITTRDRNNLDVLGVDSIYEPNEMNSDDSLLLFSRHAFKRDQPPTQYLDLSKDMIGTAGGLPLALEVLGSFLVGKGESAWQDTVKKLKKIPNHKVMGKLKISYDGLNHEEKEMFLDIACFFIGVKKDIACYIWDGSDFFPNLGIEVLCQKSLVKIGKYNELMMHDQLRDLGREIVREENFANPGERSRLWLQQEVLDVLSTQRGTSKVEGLCISFGSHGFGQCSMSEGFASMTKLRLLQLDYAKVDGNFVHSFSELRWLSWKRCPTQFTPTNLRKLVVLDLSWSEITENWMGWNYVKEAESLKVLKLSWCQNLTRTPDFSANLQLEILNFESCSNLVTIDESIGHLKRLVSLNLNSCSSLRCLPISICELSSLQTLGISKRSCDVSKRSCDDLQSLPELPSSLKPLDASHDSGLKSLPRLSHLTNLEELNLSYCMKLEKIPSTINALTRLKSLSLRSCNSLDCIPVLPLGLTYLDASECKNLKEISGFSNMRNLVEFHVNNCPSLAKIEIPQGLDSLQQLGMDKCGSLKKLPKLLGLKNLTYLKLFRIGMSKIEGLEGLDSLEKLIINECPSLTKIPKLSRLKKLACIEIKDCHALCNIKDFEEGLDSLEKLILEGCCFRKIPNLSRSKKLACIKIRWCRNLSKIEGLEGLYSLKMLDIWGCHFLTKIPNFSDSKNLASINIFCYELSEIEGLEGLDSPEELQLCIDGCRSLTKIRLPKKLSKLRICDSEKLSEIEGLEDLEAMREFTLYQLHSITKLPYLLNFKALKDLNFCSLEMLREFPSVDKLESLEKLNVANCKSIERLPDLSNLTKLRELCIYECNKLTEIHGVDKLESLETLEVEFCSIERLPDLSNLTKLRELCIQYYYGKLTEIQGFNKLESLGSLWVGLCYSIERLPDLSNLTKLRELRIYYCNKLTDIQGVDKLESLEKLEVESCKSIERLPDLSNLTKLRELCIRHCEKLTEIQGVDRLKNLEILNIDGCISIEALPCLSNLMKLQKLSAIDCKKLTEIQGVDFNKLVVRGRISMN